MECKGWTIFKWLISLGLAFAFLCTTFFNLRDYLSDKTTMSIGVKPHPQGLQLPAITICNKTAYKNIERNLNLQSYLDNTINLDEFFVSAEASNYTIKTSYTMYKGRCYTIIFHEIVTPIVTREIKLKATNLMAFVHAPGVEIWATIGYWSVKPKLLPLGSEGLLDFVLRKSVSFKKTNCNDEPGYDQYGTKSI